MGEGVRRRKEKYVGPVGVNYGVTKRCLLFWLTNSTLVYEPKCGGGVAGRQPMSTAAHRAHINFGDLTPYLIIGVNDLPLDVCISD